MRKLVSILIPAHNAERWIGETLESALRQTWPSKEIIVVDDGSSDRTLEIARGYESGILKVITQENRGASAARNTAFSSAQGDYIQWLDADDLLAPDKISRQMLEIEKGYGSGTLLSGSFGVFYLRPEKAKFYPNSLWKDLNPIEWLTRKFGDNAWMILPVWLVSRNLAESAGPWDERLSLDDDGEYSSRLVSVSENILFVPEAKSYYRQWRSGSLSRTNSAKAIQSRFLSISLCIDYLLALDNSNRARTACVRYLQARSSLFYPERQELFDRLRKIAEELGGTLTTPLEKKKYMIIEKLFGRSASKKTKAIVANTKLSTSYYWDLLSYKLHI